MHLVPLRLLLFCCLASCTLVRAQQTYFNVPSSDVVERGKLAVQQQLNIAESIRSNTTVNYGLGHEFEIGLNLNNLTYQPHAGGFAHNDSTYEESYSPLLMVNAQKAIDLSETIELAAGFQAGANLTPAARTRFAGYGYAHVAGSLLDEHYKWSAGGYAGTLPYLGSGSSVGFQTGFDAGIFYQKFHLLGDWISGTHSQGQLTLGIEVYLARHVPIALGWQRMNADGSQALTVQFTYTPN